MKNDVVIVGDGGRNQLGILREFGEYMQIPFCLLLERDSQEQKSKTEVVLASKYAKRYKIFPLSESKEDEIIRFLLNELGNERCKPIIITTCDAACEMLDRHTEELYRKFYVSNIEGKNGGIHYYLDKYNTFLKIKEMGAIDVAETFVISIPVDTSINISKYPLPCILKPRESAHGKKLDIEICYTTEELLSALKKFEALNYKEILLQEYLDYQYEFSIHGYAVGSKTIVPGICRYLHKGSIGTNDYTYIQYVRLEDCVEKEFVSKVCNYMETIKFQGCFVGEAFYVSDEKIFLNEMNYRTCDLSYNETPSGHYIAPEYVAELTGEKSIQFIKKGKSSFYSVLTFSIIKMVLSKKITLHQAISEICSASSYQYYAKGDIKPLLEKLGLSNKGKKKRKEEIL